MHVHGDEADQAAFVAYGVTSVRDMGGSLGWLSALADRGEATSEPFPRIFFSGELFEGAQSAYGDLYLLIHDEEEARAYVRRWKQWGAPFIKVYYSLPWPLQRVLEEEARRLGLPVVGHGTSAEEITKGVTLGYATLEHSNLTNRLYDDVLQMLGAAGTRWVPTLALMGAMPCCCEMNLSASRTRSCALLHRSGGSARVKPEATFGPSGMRSCAGGGWYNLPAFARRITVVSNSRRALMPLLSPESHFTGSSSTSSRPAYHRLKSCAWQLNRRPKPWAPRTILARSSPGSWPTSFYSKPILWKTSVTRRPSGGQSRAAGCSTPKSSARPIPERQNDHERKEGKMKRTLFVGILFCLVVVCFLLRTQEARKPERGTPVGESYPDFALQAPPINTLPGPEYTSSTRMYQAAPGIERTANGRLWAVWMAGGAWEEPFSCNRFRL